MVPGSPQGSRSAGSLLSTGVTRLAVALLVGVFLIAGGIARMLWAFRAGVGISAAEPVRSEPS